MRTTVNATKTASSSWVSLGSGVKNIANQGTDKTRTTSRGLAAFWNRTCNRRKEPSPKQITTSHVRRTAPYKPKDIANGMRTESDIKLIAIRDRPAIRLRSESLFSFIYAPLPSREVLSRPLFHRPCLRQS